MSTTELWLTSLAIVVLIAVSGLFSGSETAVTAASRARMLQAFFGRSGVAGPALQDHLRAVAALRTGCLRLLGAQGAALT